MNERHIHHDVGLNLRSLHGWFVGGVALGLCWLPSLLVEFEVTSAKNSVLIAAMVIYLVLHLTVEHIFWTRIAVVAGLGVAVITAIEYDNHKKLKAARETGPIFVETLENKIPQSGFRFIDERIGKKTTHIDYCRLDDEGDRICTTYTIAPVFSKGDTSATPKIWAWLSAEPPDWWGRLAIPYDDEETMPTLVKAREKACRQQSLCAPNAPILRPLFSRDEGREWWILWIFFVYYSLVSWAWTLWVCLWSRKRAS